MKIILQTPALRVLAKHPHRAKLYAKIDQLARDAASLANNITRLQGTAESRLRVGDMRIIFRFDGDTLSIRDVGPRGGIYD